MKLFVGRERERADLAAALDAAFHKRGHVVLLVGEPGIGKTTLADHVCGIASERGARVAWGRCWEPGGAPAFWPWTQALSSIVDDETLAGAGPDLLHVLPRANVVAPGPMDAASARFAIARAVTALLRSSPSPLVLVLDDLHAADHASLDLLQAVARDVRTLPLLIVGTHRDSDVVMTDDIAARLAAIARDATVHHLPRLKQKETVDLVQQTAGDIDVDSEAVAQVGAAIFVATQGNPLFVDEVVRLLAARGELHDVATASDVPLPFGVRETVRKRIATLDDEARAVLEIAAVVGDARDEKILSAVSGVGGGVSVQRAVRAAQQAGVLLEDGRFAHALYREVLHRDLSQQRRTQLHGDVARILEKMPVPPLSDVVHHLLAAGSTRAVAVVETVAPSLSRAGAYDDAIALVERARTTLALELDDALAARLHVALADAVVQAGRQDALDVAFAAAASAEKIGDARLLARAALAAGGVWRFGMVDPKLVSLLQRARAALGELDEKLLAVVEARLAGAMQPAGDPWLPIELARHAIARARKTHDDAVILNALFFGLSAMVDYIHPNEALPLNRELLARAQVAGERSKVLRAHLRILFNYAELGAFADVDKAIDAYARDAESIGAPQHTWITPMLWAMMAMVRGDVATYHRARDDARALAEKAGIRHASLTFQFQELSRAMLDHDVELGELADVMSAALSSTSHANELCFKAWIKWRAGDCEGARAIMVDLVPPETEPVLLAIVADALPDLNLPALAKRLGDSMEKYRGLVVNMGQSGFALANVFERLIAHCRYAAGDREGAAQDFATAMARAKELQAPAFVAQLERDMQRLYGAHEDVARAAPPPPTTAATTTTTALILERDGELWRVSGSSNGSFALKDSRGLQILHVLLSKPRVDVHVLDLASTHGAGGATGAVDAGDAGALLDDEAKRAYRDRLAELARDIDEAEDNADRGRAERLRGEKEAIESALQQAFGLGGRARKAGSATERARVAVQRRVKDAIERIREQDPALGKALERSIKTGVTCRYDP